jgi:hypothetical protein
MTVHKKDATGVVQIKGGDGLHIDVSDGLRVRDFETYAREQPNAANGEYWRKWHQHEFAIMLKARDDYVQDLLKDYLPNDVNIEGMNEIFVSTKPFSTGYYAVKYMLHRKLADYFLEQGHDLAADREIYLLGATWAEAKFMINYRGHAQRGEKSVTSGHDGAEETAKITRPRTQPRFEEMERLVPKLGVSGAARHLAAKGIGTFSANKGLWYRRRK